MKVNILLAGATLLLLTACTGGNSGKETAGTASKAKADILKTKENAEVKATFRPIDVDTDWNQNPFTWFKGQGLLLACGDKYDSNAMTIGWGALGNVWQQTGINAVTVYVAEGRYTYQYMEKYDYFTVMAFDKEDARILGYMGTHSGRDGNKAAHLGLHTLYTEHGAPYYEEAELVLECKTIYRAPLQKSGMSKDVLKFYENSDAGIHHMYIGNIVGAWIKDKKTE